MLQGSEVTQLGVGGLIVWLFMKEMFSFMKDKKGTNTKFLEHIEASVERIAENITRQTEILSGMSSGCKEVHNSQIRIETKLDRKP